MSVTKRTRFEILRRDNHACRYCGATAPDATLHIDHIMPVALGGSDDPSNLVAACRDCNTGKASTSPNEAIVSDVSEKALALSEAFRAALQNEAEGIRAQSAYQKRFEAAWDNSMYSTLPDDWRGTLSQWQKLGVPFEIVEHAIDITAGKQYLSRRDGEFRYVCGIVWRTLDDAQKAATAPTQDESPFDHLCIVECSNESCGSGALHDEDDDTPPMCNTCMAWESWQGGQSVAESDAKRLALTTDTVAIHIDGMESGYTKTLRFVS